MTRDENAMSILGPTSPSGIRFRTLHDPIPHARIIGPKSFVVGRDKWIGVHKDSQYAQLTWKPIEKTVRGYENAGIRCDDRNQECSANAETTAGRSRVMRVRAPDRGRQLAAVRYTALPPAEWPATR
jgi:hypothetical protein